MKMISAAIVGLLLLLSGLVSWQRLTDAGELVVGGQHVIHRGEIINGDLHTLFAQVTLEDGARLEGNILSISSALDLAGDVSGDILAIGSDTTIRTSADLLEAPHEVDLIHYVLLLPPMTRIQGSTSSGR